MVEINPFRGYTYNLEKVRDISTIIAPPWDVIDPETEKHLKALSGWNVINLISANINPSTVKDTFEQWLSEDVLIRDTQESFYFSRHNFSWMDRRFNRQGIFALLRLQDFSSGNVIPHEKVFEKYHTNRYNLIKTCRANFSAVFMLYRDESHLIDGLIDNAIPDVEGKMGNDELVSFGRIKDVAEIDRIKNLLAPGRLIIADGHHRYQGALQYYRDNPDPKNSFVLVFLVNIESPGLLILPTHRYVKSGLSFLEKKSVFEKYFEIEKMKSQTAMFLRMHQNREKKTFGIYEKGKFYTIILKDKDEVQRFMPKNFSQQWQMLDTVILHSFIFTVLFNTPVPELFFHQSADYLLNEYNKTNSGVIFFLNPVDRKQFMDIAYSGELMPQKTTYFYPKVPTGLVIHRFAP